MILINLKSNEKNIDKLLKKLNKKYEINSYCCTPGGEVDTPWRFSFIDENNIYINRNNYYSYFILSFKDEDDTNEFMMALPHILYNSPLQGMQFFYYKKNNTIGILTNSMNNKEKEMSIDIMYEIINVFLQYEKYVDSSVSECRV